MVAVTCKVAATTQRATIMAQRRMFSPQIVDSDAFLDMPISSQALYFHLGMRADDDGFVNPRKIMRTIGATDDDLKIIIAKRFVLPFENGVVVIKHWRMNNLVRKDWYKPTQYIEEKSKLFVKENSAYTLDSSQGNPVNELLTSSVTVRTRRLGKVRLGKVKKPQGSEIPSKDVVEVIDSFKPVNPSYELWFSNTSQRASIERMLKIHGKDRLLKVIAFLPVSNTIPYVPSVTEPYMLEKKWAELQAALIKTKNKELSNRTPNVAFT